MPYKSIISTAAGLCSVLAFASSSAGAYNSNLKSSSAAWRSFKYPEVVVVDRDKGGTEGSALVGRLIPDLESFIKKISIGVCQKLYKNADEVPVFDQLTFELKDYNGVAGKSGAPPKIHISMSTRYLQNQYKKMGDDAITYEIAGVNWHELTHGYQHVPKGAGGYRSGTDYFGFIEGTADAVRILAGYHNTRKPRPGGHWNDGYTTTGFFIVWLNKYRDSDFLYKLNQSCKTIAPWSWDLACKEILGPETTVSQLWDEYQWHLKGGGKDAVANFKPDVDMVCIGQPVAFGNTSFNSPTSYAWTFQGGTPATSSRKDPVVSYNKPGRYGVALVAKNKHGSTTKRIESCIHVLDEKGTVTNVMSPDGKIGHESAVSPMPGEGVENVLDGNPGTKFCLKTPTTQIQYAAPDGIRLCSYAFTSANDAPGRDPANWTLEASANGTDWTVIDQQKDQVFRDRQETRRYVVNGKTDYRFYRWNLKARSGPIFQLADIEMLGISSN